MEKEMRQQLPAIRNGLNIRLSLLAISILVPGIFLYGPAVVKLASAVIHRQGSSHGIFVPFLSIFFIWTKREVFREIEPRYDYLGVPCLAIGLIPIILGSAPYQIQFLGLIFLTGGLIMVLLGREFFKEISFPLFFLITMIPVPRETYISIANHLRDITLGGSSWLTSILGIPFFREGVIIHLPNAVLNVNIGCSGIRYLISYFVFGMAYAYMLRKSAWSRLTVIGLTIPISITASVLRLTAIFTLTYIFGPRMAQYWPHVLTSWAVFFIVLVSCISLDRFLQQPEGRGQHQATRYLEPRI